MANLIFCFNKKEIEQACDVITCKRKLLFRKFNNDKSVVTPSVAEFDILKNDIVIMLKVLWFI